MKNEFKKTQSIKKKSQWMWIFIQSSKCSWFMSFTSMKTKTKRDGRGCGAAYRSHHLSISVEAPRRGTWRVIKIWIHCRGLCLHDVGSRSQLSTEVATELSSISGLVIVSYPWVNKSGFLQLRLFQHFLHLLYLQHVHASHAAVRNNNTNKSEAHIPEHFPQLTFAVIDLKGAFLILGEFNLIPGLFWPRPGKIVFLFCQLNKNIN